MKLALAATAALIGGAASMAAANPGTKMMQKYDTNGDGKLDDSERAAMRADFAAKRAERKQKMLEKYDVNGNGKLDPSERAAMKHDRKVAMFKKLDTNGDGQISFQEFEAGKLGGGFHHGRHGKGHVRSGASLGTGTGAASPEKL
jgi:Ca2+-binding EF-hand superfamily protein